MTSLARKDLVLLFLLTLSWGINWPIMKLGVQDYPPITFRVLGMMGGLPVLWIAARMQGIALAISREELRSVARLAIPNMVLWNILIILGVKLLTSGRAAILGYTMPVWAMLFGLLLFRERPPRGAAFGVAFALGGALLLLSSEFSNIAGQPLGTLLALLAAASWGYGTVVLKRAGLAMPILKLTFWMLVIGTCGLAIVAVIAEVHAWRLPNGREFAAIAFNGLITFGFAHAVWFRLARALPPVASSLSVMFIPVVGVFSGALLLGETLHWQDTVAMVLILLSMSTVLLKPREPGHN